MKPFEINKEQKDLLLTICEKMFPEMEIFWSIVEQEKICFRKIIGISNFGKNNMGENVVVPIYRDMKIHWLELTLFCLPKKIWGEEQVKGVPVASMMPRYCWETIEIISHPHYHPVDYLFSIMPEHLFEPKKQEA